MQQSDSVVKLHDALAKAQAEFTAVPKTKTAKVRPKDPSKPTYTYKYADLADVLRMALPLLAKHGLTLTQPLHRDGGRLYVITQLAHVSGEWLRSDGLLLPETMEPQTFGSLLTYWRRYDACSLLGIAPDEDDDGEAGQEGREQAEREMTRTAAAAAPAAPRQNGPQKPAPAQSTPKPSTAAAAPKAKPAPAAACPDCDATAEYNPGADQCHRCGRNLTPEHIGDDDASLFNQAPATEEAPARPTPPQPPYITAEQSRKFYGLYINNGRTKSEVKAALQRRYGVTDDRQIPAADWQVACDYATGKVEW